MSVDALRASDADRDRVAELLHSAYAEGWISDEEHTERLLATNRAKTFGDLLPLTADLVPSAGATLGPDLPAGSSVTPSSEPDRMTVVLTDTTRNGSWRVRPRSLVTVFLGALRLDLTEATFEASVVEVNVTQVLGSVLLRVPAGTTVVNEVATVLGETSVRGLGRPNPACPTLVLKGTNILGDVKVRGPKRSLLRKRA